MATITRALEYHNPRGLDMTENVNTTRNGLNLPAGSKIGGLAQTIEFLYKAESGSTNILTQADADGTNRYAHYLADRAVDDLSHHIQSYIRFDPDGQLDITFCDNPIVQFADGVNEYMTIPAYSPVGADFTIEILLRITDEGTSNYPTIFDLNSGTTSGRIA